MKLENIIPGTILLFYWIYILVALCRPNKARPKVSRVWPVDTYTPYSRRYGYDPYNSRDAIHVYDRIVLMAHPNNMPLYDALSLQCWDDRRYNKT